MKPLAGSSDAWRAARSFNAGRVGERRFSDLVAEYLKEAILEGELRAGDPIVVAEISRRLGVSRQPVMEGLKRIEADGIVEIVPQVGCRVRQPDADEVGDFFQMFAAMEAEVSALAAARHTEDEVVSFKELMTQLFRELDRNSPGSAGHRLLNRRFHTAVHRMARSPHVARLSSALWDRSDFYIVTAFGSFRINSRVREAYKGISRAVIARDEEAARRVTREHLLISGRAASQRLRANSAVPSDSVG